VKEDEAKKKEAETKKEDWSVLRSSRFSFYGWRFFLVCFTFRLRRLVVCRVCRWTGTSYKGKQFLPMSNAADKVLMLLFSDAYCTVNCSVCFFGVTSLLFFTVSS
jgi:hypothetical protein